ncbi:MAG: hypothetical protein OXG78_13210 [Chloroflexi bacterium]|nr:hypothetical protein [Chloroflexota bacterium]
MKDLSEMELLVRATVIDADERGYSAVIHVEEYYKGEGPKLLTISRYNVGLETGNNVRGYDTGCLFNGRGQKWRAGSTGYFGFSRNLFETYTDYHYGSAHFYVWDGQITNRDGATGGFALGWDAPDSLSEEEFVAKLLEAGGRDAPIAPAIEGVVRYPLMRYLLITTENSTRYQVNPDRSVTAVDAETALFISPDDAHVAVRVDGETLGFYYVWPLGYTPQHFEQTVKVPGHDLRFSHDSHMVAVWDKSHLAIYLFRNKGPGDFLKWGVGMQMDLIASANLQTEDEGPAVVQWSADNSTIAWQDGSGLRRWDLYEDTEPEQVATAGDVNGARLLDLSDSGRYVRYGSGEGWMLYDSDTRETFPNALATPGDRHLIFVNSASKPIDDWHETESCKPPLRQNCAVYLGAKDARAITVFPYQMELLGLVACDTDCHVWAKSWHPAIDHDKTGIHDRRYISESMSNLRQIAYDPTYNQPAILRGDYQIEFDFYDSQIFDDEEKLPYLDYLNLEGAIDSPIASMEWGQPIFYDTFMLTATEYLPRTVTIAHADDSSSLQIVSDIRIGESPQ